MFYQVVYFDEVKEDIKEAKKWYRQQAKGLDKKFAADIKATIIHLSERPFSHAIRYLSVRIAHPDVFPYSIHYYVENNLVIIIAIIHNSRHPSFINKRL